MSVTTKGLDGLIERIEAVDAALREPLVGAVGSDVGYAPFIEGGTSRMAARPVLAAAVESNEDALVEMIGAAALDALDTGKVALIRAAFAEGMALIADEGASNAPVRTGNYRDSIEGEVEG